jgi:hypothetical protein
MYYAPVDQRSRWFGLISYEEESNERCMVMSIIRYQLQEWEDGIESLIISLGIAKGEGARS